MRKYIFTTAEGQEPDLRFTAEATVCGSKGSTREFACDLTGVLTLRGIPRPADFGLHIKEDGSGTFRAVGDGVVSLTTYGITPPSQFGVKPSDQVKVHLEFTGKLKPAVASAGGSR